MKIAVTLFLLLLFNNMLPGQTYSNCMSDKEVYQFIKEVFPKSKIDTEILKWEDCEFYENINCKYALNNYILQDKDSLTAEYMSDFGKQFQFIKQKNINFYYQYKNRQNKRKYTRVSIPLISADKKVALIKISNRCGDECGSGGIYIFARKQNKWKLIKEKFTWLS